MKPEWDDWQEEDYDDTDGPDPFEPRERMVLVCDLPGCVMPGYHFPSECHTAEMLEAQEAEAMRQA